jgi:hypothetical protein
MFENLMFWKKKGVDDLAALEQTAALNDSQNPFASTSQNPFANSQSSLSQTTPDQFGMSASQSSAQTYTPTTQAGWQTDSFAQSAYVQPGYTAAPVQKEPVKDNRDTHDSIHPRDVELILSRLETIRAELENVSHRLSALERVKRW